MKIETGNKGDTRIFVGNNDQWVVESVDNNGVWVLAEPGMRYDTQAQAEDAAETLAADRDGKFLGIHGEGMTSYRISDEATSNEYEASTIEGSVAKFLKNYDTAEMEEGETFTARVYSGDDLQDLVGVVTVNADGFGGVESWAVEKR